MWLASQGIVAPKSGPGWHGANPGLRTSPCLAILCTAGRRECARTPPLFDVSEEGWTCTSDFDPLDQAALCC